MPKPASEPEIAPPRENAITSSLADSPAFLVRLAQLRSFDEFHRNFAGLGVTPAGFSVFALIVANPGIRPGAIAEELRVKPSNVAVLVNGLWPPGCAARADQAELRASPAPPDPGRQRIWREMDRAHQETDSPLRRRADARRSGGPFVALLRKLLHR
jgi:hypothetical protein